MNLNKCMFVGRLADNPKLAEGSATEGKKMRAYIRVMVNRDGSEGADVIPCTLWGVQAENALKYLEKGREVTVEARYHTHSEKNADGTWKNYQSFNVERVSYGVYSSKSQKSQKGKQTSEDELLNALEAEALGEDPKAKKLIDALVAKGIPEDKARAVVAKHMGSTSTPADPPPPVDDDHQLPAAMDSADVPF